MGWPTRPYAQYTCDTHRCMQMCAIVAMLAPPGAAAFASAIHLLPMQPATRPKTLATMRHSGTNKGLAQPLAASAGSRASLAVQRCSPFFIATVIADCSSSNGVTFYFCGLRMLTTSCFLPKPCDAHVKHSSALALKALHHALERGFLPRI